MIEPARSRSPHRCLHRYLLTPEDDQLLVVRSQSAVTFACNFPVRQCQVSPHTPHASLTELFSCSLQVICRLYRSPAGQSRLPFARMACRSFTRVCVGCCARRGHPGLRRRFVRGLFRWAIGARKSRAHHRMLLMSLTTPRLMPARAFVPGLGRSACGARALSRLQSDRRVPSQLHVRLLRRGAYSI